MPKLDPTYLRYIYDNLIKGIVHPENASELPEGLIGLYEESFEEHLPVMERQLQLKRFALFALLKKEVSAAFVAEVMDESETNILDFINTYASWFNSPEPGKFQLYHERLKVYLLQKLSEKEIQVIHKKLIAFLEPAIEEQKADEFERYALEFLSEHLTVEAFRDETKGKKLLDFTKNETLWDRQIRISNKFDWSRKGLHQAALWTSKYDQEENIDCYLDLVQLHNKEQNDAENIVRLVANNEIDLALERITAFGGPSKEEKERQFILFMLCLMELTLLESKTQPWRKEAIEKLLKHLDDNLPIDHSVLDWSSFFSSSLMFQMTCEWACMDLDYMILYKRTEFIDKKWINEMAELTEFQIKILFECEKEINYKSIALIDISNELAKKGKIKESKSVKYLAFKCLKEFSLIDFSETSSNIYFIRKLSKQGEFNEAIKYSYDIKDEFEKSLALKDISIELAKVGDIEKAVIIMCQFLESKGGVSDMTNKSNVNNPFYIELTKQGKIKEALECVRSISYGTKKVRALLSISGELAKKGMIGEAEDVMKEAQICSTNISDTFDKNIILKDISGELASQGKFKESSFTIQKMLESNLCIIDDDYKIRLLKEISVEISKQGNIEEAKLIMLAAKKYSEITLDFTDWNQFLNRLYREKSIYEVKYGNTNQAMLFAEFISEDPLKIYTLIDISKEIRKNKQHDKANTILKETIEVAMGINDIYNKSIILKYISSELFIQIDIKESILIMNEAIKCSQELRDEFQKNNTLSAISIELAKQGNFEKALSCARNISFISDKSCALALISTEMTNHGKFEDVTSVIHEAFEYNQFINNIEKSFVLEVISIELVKQGKIEEALTILWELDHNLDKINLFKKITNELVKKGKWEQAESISLRITTNNQFQFCWEENAKTLINEHGAFKSFKILFKLQNKEVRKFYLNGWVDNVSIAELNIELVTRVLSFLKENPILIDKLIQAFKVKELFFSKTLPEVISIYDKFLNLQWAIDLKKELDQLPN